MDAVRYPPNLGVPMSGSDGGGGGGGGGSSNSSSSNKMSVVIPYIINHLLTPWCRETNWFSP